MLNPRSQASPVPRLPILAGIQESARPRRCEAPEVVAIIVQIQTVRAGGDDQCIPNKYRSA